ncbi:pro-interleukin-16 [Gouania willdenowi]|uniref:pro-interleukin-16 n=1 Tax=Gouania willdenowi TaxID=441366 RepID=UPI001056610F|nr:pro-interleukin-16 [Gouania willdenowi]XP_028298936.1 pro-interleukin-16 [Gouania willdenowi]
MNPQENSLLNDNSVHLCDASGPKKGPPVAPKPAWFLQSLRRIQDEQNQRRQRKSEEQLSGIRSRLSIKQKISSFESFSSSSDREQQIEQHRKQQNEQHRKQQIEQHIEQQNEQHRKQQNEQHRKQQIEQHIEQHREQQIEQHREQHIEQHREQHIEQHREQHIEQHREQQRKEIHQEMKKSQHLSGTDGLLPSASTNHSSFPLASAPSTDAITPLPPIAENLDLIRTSSSPVLSNRSEGSDQWGGTEGRQEQRQEKLARANGNKAPPTQGKPLESDGLETIITISNQVSKTLMHFLPTCCHPDLHPPSVDDSSSAELPDVDSSHRGFSFSLAALRNEDEGSSSSPDLSILSALPSHCLQTMRQEVHHLNQDTLKMLKDVHVVIFQKEEGVGLGFSVAGGCDLENKDLTVHKVFPGGVAAVGGVIEKGDVVLSINGETLYGVTHSAATAAVRHVRNLTLVVVVVCKTSETERRGERGRDERKAEEAVEAVVHVVELEKMGGSVGFTLDGGKGSIHGDRPLVINRIFRGGAAEQKGLQCGNELLMIQDISVVEMSRFEAWNLIKALPEGPVTAMVRRTRVE